MNNDKLIVAIFFIVLFNWVLLFWLVFIINKRPKYKIGTLIYYRDGYNELCVGKVLKVIKNGIIEYMIQAENNTILILNEGEILGEYGKVNFN